MKNQSLYWYLKNVDFFKVLSPTSIEILHRQMNVRSLQKGEYLTNISTDEFYVVKNGKLKVLQTTKEGRELIIDIIQNGEFIGELESRERDDDIHECLLAVEDSMLCTISKAEFMEIMLKEPVFSIQVTKLIGLRLRKTQTQLHNLVFKSAKRRVLDFIISIAEEHLTKNATTDKVKFNIDVRLTHDDVAKLTAVNRQLVSATISEIQKAGIIDYGRKNIAVLDFEKLKRLALEQK